MGVGTLALGSVAALLEGSEPTPVPARIGATDIEQIRTAQVFKSWDGHGPAFARAKVLAKIKLASLTMITGDPVQAALIGTTALDQAETLRSHRTLDRLRELSRHAAAHQHIGEVAHLRHRIGTLVLAP